MDEHSDKDLSSAVVMYMVSALQFFGVMQISEVKELALKFATLGISGIDPGEDGYIVPSITGQTFSGYKALAYYNVSWAISAPDMLVKLQMPFDNDYVMAKELKRI